ncbi:MAG: class I SAM-dependent methyltransferase [Candidatus Omnitrophica bacterium]|nr:class I SAM-dependent methyltransferase [Candidatus Omnitrophota bacterium]
MEKKVFENHKRYLERVNFYRNNGYDLEKERDFILDKSLPVSGEILEIGTGKGHFALALAKRGYNFTSIDISSQEQAVAALNLRYFGLEKQVLLKVENAVSMSFVSQSFNTVFSINVFHHLENHQAVLEEIIRLLCNGGKVVLSDFTDKGLEMINACHTAEGRTHDYFKHRLKEANEYFITKGFKTIEYESQVQKVLIAQRR